MSTLENIKSVIAQIIRDTDTYKPDLYCSEEIFQELAQRPDCNIHPIQLTTIVMLPNVYWTVDTSLVIPNIVAHTHRGELILQYLDLVSRLILEEHGSILDVQNIVKAMINKRDL